MRAVYESSAFPRLAVAIATCLAAGCSAQAPQAPSGDSLQREARGLSSTTVSSADSVVLLQVESAGPPTITAKDGVHVLSIPIGSEVPIECVISAQPEPAANEIARRLATFGDDPSERQLWAIEPLVLLDRAALYVELAVVREQEGKVSGMLQKIEVVAVGGSGTIVCTHSELGYRNTFRRTVATLAGSLRLNGTSKSILDAIRTARPTYQYIVIERVQTTPLGISEVREYRSEDGSGVAYHRAFRLLPRGPAIALGAQDYSMVEMSGPDGYVRNSEAMIVKTEDGTNREATLMALNRGEDGAYQVRTQSSAGDASERINDPRPLPGILMRGERIVKEILSGQRNSLTFPIWSPPAARFNDVRYERLPPITPDETQIERVEDGDRRILVHDAAGCWLRTEPTDPTQAFGGAERVFAQGKCSGL